MIRTVQPVITVARDQGSAKQVYFDAVSFTWDETTNKVFFMICGYEQVPRENGGVFYKEFPAPLSRIRHSFDINEFLGLVGGITFSEYPAMKNEMLIQKMAEHPDKFWGLGVDGYEPVE